MRPHRGVCLPIDTAQLIYSSSLVGRSQMRSDLLFGSLATASRDVSLPLIAAQLSPHRLQPCAHLTYIRHACDRSAAPACPSCSRTAQPLQAESCAYLADTARSRPHRGASAFCTAAQFSPRGLDPARLSCYVARLRPHRGVSLPLIAAQLSPHGLCSCAFTSLCGTRATASRRQPAPHCRAAQPSRARPCACLTMWHACAHGLCSCAFTSLCGTLATASRRQPAPHCRAAQPSRARPCAHLTMWHACATASRRQPAFHRRAAQPSRARPCAHLTMWQTTLRLACDRIAVSACPSLPHNSALTRARPCALILTMWHACGHTVAPACALIAAQLSPRGLQLCVQFTRGTPAAASRSQPALHAAQLCPHGR